MTQLLQEERDFYKRECELLRNMKEKSAMMSPPTRERVTHYTAQSFDIVLDVHNILVPVENMLGEHSNGR